MGGGGEGGGGPCHAERFHAKLSTNQHTPPPTCPPSPTNGLALSTCLSVNQPIRPQNEDTEEEEEQTDSRWCWENPPSLLQFRPVMFRSYLSLLLLLFTLLTSPTFISVPAQFLHFPQCLLSASRKVKAADERKFISRVFRLLVWKLFFSYIIYYIYFIIS